MPNSTFNTLKNRIPGLRCLLRLPGQLCGTNPFQGDCLPRRVPLIFAKGRPALPFPHPWNYQEPIRILETYFHGADAESGGARHNRFLDFPGFPPVLVTRDPAIIRAITTNSGDGAGQFDRDTLPSSGIARSTGKDTLLYSNGALWRHQRKLAAPPFGKTTLFQPEIFHEFAETFRTTVRTRLLALETFLRQTDQSRAQISLEPEIKAVMLEMLTNNFFGTAVPYQELRDRFVPALDRLISHIVRDTVTNRLGLPLSVAPAWLSRRIAQAKTDNAAFNELTDSVLATRHEAKGLWKQFRSDAPDAALRSNIKVFLAGALEATTSYATWAISHLARNPDLQERVYSEVRDLEDYSPDALERAVWLRSTLDETLRLTPSLYFLPRQASVDTWVETSDKRRMLIPQGTHILLDVWHANRHEDFWGIARTGYPADQFAPERWQYIMEHGGASKDFLHFGFGHGPRVCPGKHLGQLEVALVTGALVKLFRFRAVNPELSVRAGVSTKPADGTLVELEVRAATANGI